MTLDELKADYVRVVKTLKAERAMRERVFANKPPVLETKLEEIDAALAALERIKDQAKRAILVQAALLQ